MTSLCGVWWCCNMICMASTFPKVKKSFSWKTSSVSKEEVVHVHVHLHSHGITWDKYDIVITKRMKAETSESIEPNNNDLELNAIAHPFSKIFQPEM